MGGAARVVDGFGCACAVTEGVPLGAWTVCVPPDLTAGGVVYELDCAAFPCCDCGHVVGCVDGDVHDAS